MPKSRLAHEIVYLDPNRDAIYSLSGSTLSREATHSYNKKNVYAASFDPQIMLRTSVDIDREISEEELADVIYDTVVEEMGLQEEIRYQVRYQERGTNYDNTKITYEVHLVDEQDIHVLFDSQIEKVPYIDYIVPTPFVFESLYDANVLPTEGVHGFIYFGAESAFFLLFMQGRLSYYKPIELSLERIMRNYNEISPTVFDFHGFCELMANEEVPEEEERFVMKIYDEIASHLEEVILYCKRSFEITDFDTLYIDGDVRFAEFFYSHISQYLLTTCEPYQFDYGINAKANIGHLGLLTILTAREYMRGKEVVYNFTLYPKPKPLPQRDSGRLILVTAAALVLSMGYPFYNFLNTQLLLQQNADIREEANRHSSRAAVLKAEITMLQEDHKDVKERLGLFEKETERKFKILSDIYSQQENYLQKTGVLVELMRYVDEENTRLKEINVADVNHTRKVLMVVEANDDKKITGLVKRLGDDRKYSVDIETIARLENSKNYHAEIGLQIQ